MSFPQAMRQVLGKYADFSGRAMRSEFWWWVLAITLVSVVFGMVDSALPFKILQPVFGLLALIPTLAVGTRRLHDTGRSGWWMLPWSVIWLIFGTLLFVFVVIAAEFARADAGRGELPALGAFVFGILALGVLLVLVPVATWAIIWLAQRGEEVSNRFGEVPRLGS